MKNQKKIRILPFWFVSLTKSNLCQTRWLEERKGFEINSDEETDMIKVWKSLLKVRNQQNKIDFLNQSLQEVLIWFNHQNVFAPISVLFYLLHSFLLVWTHLLSKLFKFVELQNKAIKGHIDTHIRITDSFPIIAETAEKKRQK